MKSGNRGLTDSLCSGGDENGGQKQNDSRLNNGERRGLARRFVVTAKDAEQSVLEAAHGDGEDAAEAAQNMIALAAFAPSEPGVRARVESDGESFLLGDRQIVKTDAQ